jgi:hypothetical protein
VFVKLLGLQYRLVYKKGAKNSAADALSRRVHSDSHILAVSSATPAWIEEIANSYEQDEKASELVAKLSVTPSNDKVLPSTMDCLDTREKFGLVMCNH